MSERYREFILKIMEYAVAILFFIAIAWVALFLLIYVAKGGEVHLAWDKNPPQDLVQAYVVYEHVTGTNWEGGVNVFVPVQSVRTNYAVLTNVYAGEHCYVVTASNFWGESVFSNEACTLVVSTNTTPPPPPPGGVTIPLTIHDTNGTSARVIKMEWPNPAETTMVQTSNDVISWEDWLTISQNSESFYLSNFNFDVTVDRPIQFWRVVQQ